MVAQNCGQYLILGKMVVHMADKTMETTLHSICMHFCLAPLEGLQVTFLPVCQMWAKKWGKNIYCSIHVYCMPVLPYNASHATPYCSRDYCSCVLNSLWVTLDNSIRHMIWNMNYMLQHDVILLSSPARRLFFTFSLLGRNKKVGLDFNIYTIYCT